MPPTSFDDISWQFPGGNLIDPICSLSFQFCFLPVSPQRKLLGKWVNELNEETSEFGASEFIQICSGQGHFLKQWSKRQLMKYAEQGQVMWGHISTVTVRTWPCLEREWPPHELLRASARIGLSPNKVWYGYVTSSTLEGWSALILWWCIVSTQCRFIYMLGGILYAYASSFLLIPMREIHLLPAKSFLRVCSLQSVIYIMNVIIRTKEQIFFS